MTSIEIPFCKLLKKVRDQFHRVERHDSLRLNRSLPRRRERMPYTEIYTSPLNYRFVMSAKTKLKKIRKNTPGVLSFRLANRFAVRVAARRRSIFRTLPAVGDSEIIRWVAQL